MTGRETLGFSWNVLLAISGSPDRACSGALYRSIQLLLWWASWRDQPSTTMVHPGLRQLQILRELLLPFGTGGSLTSDARLAALAIEHDAELCSSDTDFARFIGLKWRNPMS